VDCKSYTCSTNFEYKDFGQVYTGNNADKGIVKQTLDSDNKPVYAGGSHVSIVDPSEFQYWFRTIPGYNIPITQDLVFTNCDPKTTQNCNDEYYTKDNTWFPSTGAGYWPLDKQGYGDWWSYQGKSHNYGFTMEIATKFVYRGGEVFKFNGDDDLYIFVNGKLALDIGGVHNSIEGTINMDSLGLAVNKSYPFHIFYCERHTPGSGFYATTSVGFTCDVIDRCGICYGDGQSCCTCNDNSVCTTDTCDPNSSDQKCIYTKNPCPNADKKCLSTTCDPVLGCQSRDISSNCIGADKCYNYACSNTSSCSKTKKPCASTICQTATCDPNVGTCTYTNACPAVPCSTFTGCTPATGCQYTPVNCTSVGCNVSRCDPSTSTCKVTTLSPPVCNGCNTTSCNNGGNLCLSAYCDENTGQCQKPSTCTSSDVCTVATCDPADGICVKSSFCTTNDTICFPVTCAKNSTGQAQCTPSSPPCDDGNACTTDFCSSSNGTLVCTHTFSCDDGNACTENTCVNNTCTFVPIECPITDLCTSATCDTQQGCLYQNITIPDYGNKCLVTGCDSKIGLYNSTYPCQPSDRCSCDPKEGCQCSPLSIAQIAGITGGAIAGATVGAVAGAALLGFGAKKGYDAFAASQAAAGVVNDNPMYVANGGETNNPFYSNTA